MTLWQRVWDEALGEAQERNPEFDTADYYRSGRSSKINPDKEDPKWWAKQGPVFVERWENWRKATGMRLAEFPGTEGEAVPGIELEVWAKRYTLGQTGEDWENPGLQVRSIIDRVFVDEDDNLVIVDLKTGSHTDPWPLQMALNNLCLRHTYGVSAKYAGFWKARTGGVDTWHDLSRFTDDVLWDWVAKARSIRDQQLFIPAPGNLCNSACGVSQWCVAQGGKPFVVPTVQHSHKETK